jgi:hypothetical protein
MVCLQCYLLELEVHPFNFVPRHLIPCSITAGRSLGGGGGSVTGFSRFLWSYIPSFFSADKVCSLTFVVDIILVLKIIAIGEVTPLSLEMNYRLCIENLIL